MIYDNAPWSPLEGLESPSRPLIILLLKSQAFCRAFYVLAAQAEEAEPLPHSHDHSIDAQLEISDTIKVAALINKIKSRGHSVAQLDPLRRVKYGPWMAEGEQHISK